MLKWLLFCSISFSSVLGDSCSIVTEPVAVLSISTGLPYSELSVKPNITNFANLTNASMNCCLYEEGQKSIWFCDDFIGLLKVLKQNNNNQGQMAFHFGSRRNSTKFVVPSDLTFEVNFGWVYIFGHGNVTIHHKTGQHFFSFHRGNETVIQHVSFTNGGLNFTNCQSVHLTDVHIHMSTLGGCVVKVEGLSPLSLNSTMLFNFSSCSFIRNGHSPIHFGGLSMSIKENVSPVSVIFKNCQFHRNYAQFGGAVSVVMKDLPNNKHCQNLVPTILIDNCIFKDNVATRHGGALYFKSYSGALYRLNVSNSSFTNNYANDSGGAIYSTIRNYDIICDASSVLVFYNCSWTHNSAQKSAAILLKNTKSFRSNVTIEKSILSNNFASHFSFGDITYCVMYCDGMNVTLVDTKFHNNSASGFCSRNSKTSIEGNVVLGCNIAYKGGGIYLGDNAWISLDDASNLTLVGNSAVYGGGLYQTSLSNVNSICFLETQSNTTTYFTDNIATISGGNIYFQSPDSTCQQELKNVSFTFGEISSTVHVLEIIGNYSSRIDLMLGQKLVFDANVTDFFGNASSAIVNIFLLEMHHHEIGHDSLYKLRGLQSFAIINGTNSPDVYIFGPNITDNSIDSYALTIITSQKHSQKKEKKPVNISSCRFGFSYDKSTRKCVCALQSKNIHCNLSTGIACIRKGYWYGQIDSKGLVTAPCSSGNCKNIADNSCTVCANNGFTTFCQLPQNESNQCIGNWAGVLCTECIHGYAYSFQTQQCLDSSTCSGASALIPTVLMLAYLLIVICIIFVILKLGDRVKTGYIYCILYYFSIIKLIVPASVAISPLKIITSILQSFLQLDSYFLGYIPVCVSSHMTVIEHKVLTFLSPLIVTLVIVGVIGVSRRFTHRFWFRNDSILKAISLLALMSFTTLTEASFSIIIPVEFDDISDGTYVKIQPHTKYLDTKEHLIWWLIAMLVLSMFVIPFTLLLLFSKILVRHLNLIKIKPFLDEFQGCYKDKLRWMAGYYFLCRIVVFLSLSSADAEAEVIEVKYVALFLSILVLMVHMILQPYKDEWLNAIDSILLGDLVFIALLTTVSSSEIVFDEIRGGETLQQFFAYLLLAIPFLYLMAILIKLTFPKKLSIGVKQKVKTFYVRRKTSDIKDHAHVKKQQILPTRVRFVNNQFREPLLDISEEDYAV